MPETVGTKEVPAAQLEIMKQQIAELTEDLIRLEEGVELLLATYEAKGNMGTKFGKVHRGLELLVKGQRINAAALLPVLEDLEV